MSLGHPPCDVLLLGRCKRHGLSHDHWTQEAPRFTFEHAHPAVVAFPAHDARPLAEVADSVPFELGNGRVSQALNDIGELAFGAVGRSRKSGDPRWPDILVRERAILTAVDAGGHASRHPRRPSRRSTARARDTR